MYSIARRVQFSAGHRVHGHESKCAHLHGHNYVALIHATAGEGTAAPLYPQPLDSIGRVIDFSVLKAKVGDWIDRHWDHGFVYWESDEATIGALQTFRVGRVPELERGAIGPAQKSFALPTNPTAENMAAHLLNVVCPQVLQGTGVHVWKVELWETENCKAEVTL